MDNKFLRCDMCKIVFNNVKDRNRHTSSKEHSTVMQMQYQHTTVFVSGLSSDVSDDILENYFSQYGPVKKLRIVKKEGKGAFAFVTFENANTVETVLLSVHYLGQDRLKVSPKIIDEPKKYHIPEKSKDQIHKELCYMLRSSPSIADSMEKLCEDLQLTEKDFMVRNELKQKIINILKSFYPECEVHIYGSTMNGVGLKNSDVDLLFLPTSEFCNTDVPKQEGAVPTLHDFKTGEVTPSHLSGLDSHSQLRFVNQIFRSYRALFLRPFVIPAKCPVINFCFHLRGVRMHCDFSCSNRLVLFNTQLIKLYVDMDERVKQLLMTLRYWAKYHTFVKKGILSSYAFSLLVIFYLQNVEPPVLPSVQQLLDADDSHIIAGWECGISTDLETKPSDNTQSAEELLLGFFKFCSEFDFVSNIICVSSGEVMPVKLFGMQNDPRLNDFKVSAMMIQDPFELSRNVSSTMKNNTLIALKIKIDQILESYRNKPSPVNLSPLFEPFTCKIAERKAEGAVIPCSVYFLNQHYFYLNEIFSDHDKIKTIWFEQASQAVFDALKYGLMISCEIVDKKTTPVTICEEAEYFDSEIELLLSIQCNVYYCTWNNRNQAMQQISSVDKNVLQLEEEISQNIIENNPLQCYKESKISFVCDCFRYTKLNILDVLVLFKPLTLKESSRGIYNFLRSYLPKTVSKVMEEQLSNYSSIIMK